MYQKFFEVNYSAELGNVPEAKSRWWYYDNLNEIEEIVPVVFFKNNVFLKSTKEELDLLADNVNFLIEKYIESREFKVSEFQMDCDWTLSSRDNYFYFLNKIKELTKKKISCTLRLYPYKYSEKMGVPPVDKVSLMCYNLMNPLENPQKNSILDLPELKSYLEGVKKYPIHMDIALPVYSWAQVYHNQQFSLLLYTDINELWGILKEERPLWYSVLKDTVINNTYLREGDELKLEEIDAERVNNAISILKHYIDFDKDVCVSLFHLDEVQLRNYTNEEINSFYTAFSE
ncbi:MAG: hypothetical protein R2809_14150 [Flavobacteriales bacterium]